MAAYADFYFYKNVFLGTAVSEADFPGLAVKVSAFIDRMTFNRLRSAEEIPEEVKMAVCAIVERMDTAFKANATGSSAAVKSENNDGYSITYNALSDIRAELTADYEEAALLFLYGSPLLYAGLDLPKRRCCR